MVRSSHLLAFALAALAASGAAARAAECKVPPEIIADDPKLEHMAAAFKAGEKIRIVVIGGASTAGTAAGNADLGYPHRLQEALAARRPGLQVEVINKGVPRQTTRDMIQRFETDVYPAHPTLVIWETGTVDAVRGTDVDQFAAAVGEGIAALRQHNFDVMLVDMQYNPSTQSVINFEPYLESLRHAADFEDIYLFRRFEAMKYWSEHDVFDFVDVPKEQRVHLAEEVYRCLGEAMADAIDIATE